MPIHFPIKRLLTVAALLVSFGALGQEAVIRKNLAERLPNLPKIDEVTRTPVAGLYEVRFGGTDILYSDATGEHVFVNGALIETKTRTDLTEARLDKLLAVDFDKLPLKDAMSMRQGNGTRKMAVFVDPNCGYCKRFERDLVAIKDVTIYTFMMPILGPTPRPSRATSGAPRSRCAPGATGCSTASCRPRPAPSATPLRSSATWPSSRSNRITGTPAVFFEDGTRKPGAIPGAEVERLLVAASAKK